MTDEGTRLGIEGQEAALVNAERKEEFKDFLSEIERDFLALLNLGPASIDDLELILPDDMSPNSIGSIIRRLKKQDLIHSTGFRRSKKPSRHGSIVQVWELVEKKGI